MAKFRVNSCCGCITLRNGTIIVAVLGLLGTIFKLAQIIWEKVAFDDLINDDGLTVGVYGEYPKDYADRLFAAVLLCYLLNGLFQTLLLYGAIKESKYFLLPWLILTGSLMVTMVYVCIMAAVMLPMLLIAIPCIVFASYFWIVIFSYYQMLTVTEPNQSRQEDKPQV